MTHTFSFTVEPNPNPASPERRAEILAAPGFGKHVTDNMVTIDYRDGAWHSPRVHAYGPLTLDPSAMVLHYGQAIFEGLKVYRWDDETLRSFRPYANAQRLNSSAARMAMPALDEELFVNAIRQLLAVDGDWVPRAGGEESLYIRPVMFATEPGLGVRPAREYTFLLFASPAGAYFSGGISPVTVWLSREYVRASPGGTGAAKFAGNYAASLKAQEGALAEGCDQVVWLDAIERTYIEEMGGMNLFFVFGSGSDVEVVTPELSGSLLPGITRQSLLQLAADAGYRTSERKVSVDELHSAAESGELTEVFACGTAAVITPVGRFKGVDEDFKVSGGATGTVTMQLRETLTGIQRGAVADTHEWMTIVSAP